MSVFRRERSLSAAVAPSRPRTGTDPGASPTSGRGASSVGPVAEADVFPQVVRGTDPTPLFPALGPPAPQEAAEPRRSRTAFDLAKGRLHGRFPVPIFRPPGGGGEQVPLP